MISTIIAANLINENHIFNYNLDIMHVDSNLNEINLLERAEIKRQIVK